MSQRHEGGGRNPFATAPPAQQRFGADNFARTHRDLCLVVAHQGAVTEGRAQIGDQGNPFAREQIDAAVVSAETSGPRALGFDHRGIRVLEQGGCV
ncbi:hypothetical protein RM530_03695 [Algiphilus sp. W345]|uniref:Uncharacterized protein n=1 Tax=Banduia mediterranea TaxID=3075609 RepID=A0ABU2WG36_9GAMM|nr:hypothetical protein [Algiphilus sp. W345]MDT0496468.1 hypothetical protein [Algiphilus sp. W345]